MLTRCCRLVPDQPAAEDCMLYNSVPMRVETRPVQRDGRSVTLKMNNKDNKTQLIETEAETCDSENKQSAHGYCYQALLWQRIIT